MAESPRYTASAEYPYSCIKAFMPVFFLPLAPFEPVDCEEEEDVDDEDDDDDWFAFVELNLLEELLSSLLDVMFVLYTDLIRPTFEILESIGFLQVNEELSGSGFSYT